MYVRTWESTKVLLEKVSKEKLPCAAVHHVVTNNLKGLEKCSGVGQVPRNRQQASDLKRNRNDTTIALGQRKSMSGEGRSDDPWYSLFNTSKRESKCKKTAFVRDVRVGSEPLCVLASERQLNDLKRFCCYERQFKPLTVDPTFNIGRFNVTPISYQHLALENKNGGKHPTFIGPILIHEKKNEETYSTFCASLKSLEPELANLMAFGTDNKKALENAFNNNFERAIHLLCELHLKKTVEKKLLELGVTGMLKQDFLADVFGRRNGDVFESGLPDARSKEEFDSFMRSLKGKWQNAHVSGNGFYRWFLQNKAEEFIKCVIRPVRERAGLGSPPERFTTNRSERTNGVIQEFVSQECGKGKVDEHTFAVTMKKLITMQEKEAELAVIGKGQHKLRDSFNHLFVPAARWSKMTDKQRQLALAKIHTASLGESRRGNIEDVTSALGEQENSFQRLFVEAQIDWLPRDILASITTKAIALKDSVYPLPGSPVETVIVPSNSNPKKPHIVVFSANGKCECQDCEGYSASFVCAHAIPASAKINRLDGYLRWLATTKRKTGGINFSKAITHGMPTGREKKPNQAPRKCRKTMDTSANQQTVIPRVGLQHPYTQNNETRQEVFLPVSSVPQPEQLCRLPFGPRIHRQLYVPTQQVRPPNAAPTSVPSALFNQSTIRNQMPATTFSYPGFPSPQPGAFLIYLLRYCPQQTSVCFG